MASRREAPRASGALERHPFEAGRRRGLELWELEHETLAPVLEFGRESDALLVHRLGVPGAALEERRPPKPAGPALLLQGVAAAAFFAVHGFPIAPEELARARWDASEDSPRLWLARAPSGPEGSAPQRPLPETIRRLLETLFSAGGRLSPAAARELARGLDAPGAESRRPEFWVASVFRAFPELGGPAAAAARRRCLGATSACVRARDARAASATARALLGHGTPRVFRVDGSALTPGAALGLRPPAPGGVAEAVRRLRSEADAGARARPDVWIAVAREEWDTLSRTAFEAAAIRLGDRVQVVDVSDETVAPAGPDAWRRALWIPCGTLQASVRLYEWLASLGCVSGREARARALDVLGGSGFARFSADPTGDAPLPLLAGEPARQHPAPELVPDPGDPGTRVERALAAGRVQLALAEADRWILSRPEARPEAWFELSSRLSAHVASDRPSWLEALEAEREIVGGRTREALIRLDAIGARQSPDRGEKRRARLRAAEVAMMLGDAAAGARRAAAWRREHPQAPADEARRALRLGAEGLAREGRTDCALALLAEAAGLGEPGAAQDVDDVLARARVLSLAGRFEEEDRLYDAGRPLALSGDDAVAARFLAQEGRALLDRREFSRALLRFEEALRQTEEPAERAALLIDVAATRYHAADRTGSEDALTQARSFAAAAGREDLARLARGNRVELLIDRGAFSEAGREIAEMEADARRDGDSRRRLVALHQRARLALRRGDLAAAAGDNAEARSLAAAIGDRLEIGELWLEDGDRAACEGDRDAARQAWELAAADPPDRCETDALARSRLAELDWPRGVAPPDAELARADAALAADPLGAGETLARWSGMLGPETIPPALRERARQGLRAAGAPGLADLLEDGKPRVLREALRGLRDAVAGALVGDGHGGPRALGALGLDALALRDGDGRELVRFEREAGRSELAAWRPLEAGGGRFELALAPDVPETAASPLIVMLEALLYRARPEARDPLGDFAEGWKRLGLITADEAMREPYRRLARFSPQPVTVLILGESGSGKEAVARAVHRLSARSQGPFVPVNIPAIPEPLAESELFGHARGAFTGADRERRGLLEEAGGGTIFFDEIGDLAPALQSKLLRALQEGEVRRVGENRARAVDLRVVSATSRDLVRDVEAGRFREDLFYRLHVAVVRLPPLRERGRDVLLLARHFLERFGREFRGGPLALSAEAAGALLAYPWPGNVRELQNAMAQAAALGDGGAAIGPDVLPEPVRGSRPARVAAGDYRTRVDAHRRDLIADALDRFGGNRTRAARDLGLSRQALLYLIKELKVEASPRKPSGGARRP